MLNKELDSSFNCMLDSAPDTNKTYSTLSGVGRFNESDEREPTTVAERFPAVVPPGFNESDGRECLTVAENISDVAPSSPPLPNFNTPLPNLNKGEKSSKKRKRIKDLTIQC